MKGKNSLKALIGGFALGVLANSCVVEENYSQVIFPISDRIYYIEPVKETCTYFNLFGQRILSWDYNISSEKPLIGYLPKLNEDLEIYNYQSENSKESLDI